MWALLLQPRVLTSGLDVLQSLVPLMMEELNVSSTKQPATPVGVVTATIPKASTCAALGRFRVGPMTLWGLLITSGSGRWFFGLVRWKETACSDEVVSSSMETPRRVRATRRRVVSSSPEQPDMLSVTTTSADLLSTPPPPAEGLKAKP